MRMRQETFKKSYYIPAFGKSIEIRRNQDIDEDGILGKELLAQYGEDCILEGETKSLMEKVASGDIGGSSLTTEQTAAIEKIAGMNSSAREIDGKVIPIDTIALLRAKTVTPSTVWVSGYHTKNDGAFGSNIFRWNPTSTATDNGGTIIKLTSITTGRYELQYSGAVNVKWFGAVDNSNITSSLQHVLNLFGDIIIEGVGYTISTVSLTRNTKIIGDGNSITIGTGSHTNGIVSNGFNIEIVNLDFYSLRNVGIFTQALTITNSNSIIIKDCNFDNFSQFTINAIYNIAGIYEKIIIDNIQVTNAGNIENGINNCLEILHRGCESITNIINISNSYFSTITGTGGNIAKFGVSNTASIDNCIFKSVGRTTLSGSSAIEFGNKDNTLALTANRVFNNCVIEDDSSVYYSLGGNTGGITIKNSRIYGQGISFVNPKMLNIRVDSTSLYKLNIEANVVSSKIDNISIENCEFDFLKTSGDEFMVIDAITVHLSTINAQITTKNTIIKTLSGMKNKFNINTAEHYFTATQTTVFSGNIVTVGSNITTSPNTFVFYGCIALVSENIISLSGNRTYYITCGNLSLVRSICNIFEKNNLNFYGSLGGKYIAYNNIQNGNFSDIATKLKLYGVGIPSIGTYVVGDKVYNTNPTPLGNIGWVCTTAGTPGTWKGFGAISE